MVDNLFLELAIVLALSLIFAGFGSFIKQPLIVSFIAVGILSGPQFLGLITSNPTLELLSHLGIALLLFVVGLKLDLNMLKNFGPVIIFAGLGQVIFTSFFGFILCLIFGMDTINAVYVAVALTFSSTIIIIKLLTDKKETDSLHGRIAIGILIVQDLLVVIALLFLSSFGIKSDNLIYDIFIIILKGFLFISLIALSMKFILNKILVKVAKSQELLVLFAVTWAVVLSEFALILGFTHEIGAFLAGVSLASSYFKENIANRLSSIRDFLLLFFFVKLGASIDFSIIGQELKPSILLSLFVLIGNPLIVMIIMGFLGYKKRTGFLTGLTVAQISEFSLVLGALGLSLGHINSSSMAIITLVALITISLSTYLIIYSYPIYAFLAPLLNIFEKKQAYSDNKFNNTEKELSFDVLIIGMGRFGSNISKNLVQSGHKILAVDFDPKVVSSIKQQGGFAIYGDIEDPDLILNLPLSNINWLLITLPDVKPVIEFIKNLKKLSYNFKIAATALRKEDELLLKKEGIDLVFSPYTFAADLASDYLSGSASSLQKNIPWPVSMKEFRVASKSKLCGKKLSEINLRANTGANIVAVTRSGDSFYKLEPDFQIFPGDLVLLSGNEAEIQNAKTYFIKNYDDNIKQNDANLSFETIEIDENSNWIGQSIKDLDLRKNYNLNLIAVKRADKEISSPNPDFIIQINDIIYAIKNS